MNEQTIQAINQWASAIRDAVVHVAPIVWRTATGVKQADCIGNLVTGGAAALIMLTLAIVLAHYAVKFYSTARSIDVTVPHDESFEWPGVLHYIGGVAFSVGCMICAYQSWLYASSNLLDQWQWIGAFNPGLAVAHDVMVKALSQ